MTDQDSRTASQIIRGDVPAGRVRIRTEPVLPVIRPEVNGGGPETRPVVFDIRDMAVYYGSNRALVGTTLKIYRNLVTAVIGPSGLREVDLPPQPQPDERLDPGVPARGSGPLPRPRRLRQRRQPGRGAPPDRDGVPEAQPVPEVDLRQRRLGGAEPRHEAAARRARRARPAPGARCGRRSRTGCATARSGCPAASSSGCASRGRSRSSRTCCCSTSRPRRSTRSSTATIEDLMHTLKQPVHDRDRHPQHAAGRARRRPHRVLQPRLDRRRAGRAR